MWRIKAFLNVIYRKLHPRYVDIEIEFTDSELEHLKRAAKERKINIHQYVTFAMEEYIKEQNELTNKEEQK